VPMPARMIPIAPFGARFFKNARACPRHANPHIQALYKSSTVLPLPLSADSLLYFALSIAKPPTQFARDYCAKRLRRTHHPTTIHFLDPSHSQHNLFPPWHVLGLPAASARRPQSERPEIHSSQPSSLLSFIRACDKLHIVVQRQDSVITPNTVVFELTRKHLASFLQLLEDSAWT
jgi:hypothetical protein